MYPFSFSWLSSIPFVSDTCFLNSDKLFHYLVGIVSTANPTILDEASLFSSFNTRLPKRSEVIQEQTAFKEYIPVGCVCDRIEGNAVIRYLESPIVGLLTRDGKIVKSLKVKANEGDLIFIIMIDPQSNLSIGTYLEKTSYWHLVNDQYELPLGEPLDLELRRHVALTVVRKEEYRFLIGIEIMRSVIGSLQATFASSTIMHEEMGSKEKYHFSPSLSNQVVGVYQLLREFITHPGTLLSDYVSQQKTDVHCTSYLILKQKCGVLKLFTLILQHAASFKQETKAIEIGNSMTMLKDKNFDLTNDSSNALGHQLELSRKGLTTKWRIATVFLSIGLVLLGCLVASIAYFLKRYHSQRHHPVLAVEIEDLWNKHKGLFIIL